MKSWSRDKLGLHLSIVASLLIFLYQLGKVMNVQVIWQYDWALKFLLNTFFIAVLVVSFVYLYKRRFAPLLIQLGGIAFTLVFLYATNQVTDTEKNFHIYKKEREELIQLVLDNRIATNASPLPESGQFSVPGYYLEEGRHMDILGKIVTDQSYFFFFPIDTQGYFGDMGLGVTEGFVYSSLNRPPTWQEFDAGGQLKHIEGHWYYLNSQQENFEKECPTLCE